MSNAGGGWWRKSFLSVKNFSNTRGLGFYWSIFDLTSFLIGPHPIYLTVMKLAYSLLVFGCLLKIIKGSDWYDDYEGFEEWTFLEETEESEDFDEKQRLL